MSAFPPHLVAATPAAARRLEVADLSWATELLAVAVANHPALHYVCAGTTPQQHRWLLRQLLDCTLRHGSVYANAASTAVVLWLGPDYTALTWYLWLRLLPSAAWNLGWASCGRLWRLLRTQAWLRHQNLSGAHHLLLALAVHPASRGRAEGRRLLAATLALRQATGLPCYLSTQLPAQLAFYQRHGFVLAGHCTVGKGPAGPLSTWGMLCPSPLVANA